MKRESNQTIDQAIRSMIKKTKDSSEKWNYEVEIDKLYSITIDGENDVNSIELGDIILQYSSKILPLNYSDYLSSQIENHQQADQELRYISSGHDAVSQMVAGFYHSLQDVGKESKLFTDLALMGIQISSGRSAKEIYQEIMKNSLQSINFFSVGSRLVENSKKLLDKGFKGLDIISPSIANKYKLFIKEVESCSDIMMLIAEKSAYNYNLAQEYIKKLYNE